jgi:hypothetical protein
MPTGIQSSLKDSIILNILLTIFQARWYNVLWHVNTVPGKGSINTPRYAQTTIGRMFIARCYATVCAPTEWRDSYDLYYVTCFMSGLRYATIGLCFLRFPCGGYTCITRVRLQLRRVQEGSAVESTRTRMESVLNELWRLIEYRLGQSSTDWLKRK